MANLRSARTTYKNTLRTTDAWFVRIERSDGTIVRITDSAQDITMSTRVLADGTTEALSSNVTYYAASGYNPTAAAKQDGLQAGTIDIQGILDATTSSASVSESTEKVPIAATGSSTTTERPDITDEPYVSLIQNRDTSSWQWWPATQPSNADPAWVRVDFGLPEVVNKITLKIISSAGTDPYIGVSYSDDDQRYDEIIPKTVRVLATSGSVQTLDITLPFTIRTRYLRLDIGDGTMGLGNIRWSGLYFYHDRTVTNTGTVSRVDVENGLYENAKVFIFLTDYTDPYEDDEKIISGFINNIELRDGTYVAQMMSKLDAFSYRYGRKYSAACDAVFGSFRCGAHLEPPEWVVDMYATAKSDYDLSSGTWVKPTTPNGFYYYASNEGLCSATTEPTWPTSVGATVVDNAVTWVAVSAFVVDSSLSVVTDARTVEVSSIASDPNDTWTGGIIELTSGDLTGVKSTIKLQTGAVIVLSQPLKNLPSVADTVKLTKGCRKRFTEDCKTKFDNAVNFQGFPFIPGSKVAGKFGGQ